MNKQIDISIKQLVNDLGNGLTRLKKDDFGFGSIEEKYGMKSVEVDVIFRHPKLKDVKTTEFRFRLIDDTDETFNASSETVFSEPAGPDLTAKRGDRRFIEAPRAVAAASEVNVPAAPEPAPVEAVSIAPVTIPVMAEEFEAAPKATNIGTVAIEEEESHDYMNLL